MSEQRVRGRRRAWMVAVVTAAALIGLGRPAVGVGSDVLPEDEAVEAFRQGERDFANRIG